MELLVATAVAGVALAGAWAWLWTVAAPARSLEAQAQSGSAAAFALRAVIHDLQESTAILSPVACAPERGLLLEHHQPATAPESITIVWDESRQVLWRKTSSTYLADHVTHFVVTYLSPFAEVIEAGAAGQGIPGVAMVRVELTVTTGDADECVGVDVAVRLQ